jgi:hypothetical protein
MSLNKFFRKVGTMRGLWSLAVTKVHNCKRVLSPAKNVYSIEYSTAKSNIKLFVYQEKIVKLVNNKATISENIKPHEYAVIQQLADKKIEQQNKDFSEYLESLKIANYRTIQR